VVTRTARILVAACSLAAGAVAVHTAVNLRYLRRPSPDAPTTDESIAVLIPARNEAETVGATVRSALAQEGISRLRVTVLDDGSTDGTADVVEALASSDPRLRLELGGEAPPPRGWLGKPWACARLAATAPDVDIVCFVDADVILHPHAIRAAVATLREGGFALVAPYPRQLTGSWLERLVQPLVTWSWAATMPVRWAESSQRPSLSAANGQLLVLDGPGYAAIGGHGAVRSNVLEDIGLMRALKRGGFATSTVDGSGLAECRMYDGTTEVVDGYAKSLWSAFGGPVQSAAACAGLVAIFVIPGAAAVVARDRTTRAIGAAGYAAGVASRALVARRTGEPVLPDALAHPLSISAFAILTGISWQRHARGLNSWKGRPVTVGSSA